eukprot:20396_1
MTTNWNNTFHIDLPSIDMEEQKNSLNLSCCSFKKAKSEVSSRAISVKIAIMMHNSGKLGADLADITATDKTVVIADMTSAAVNFTVPDILSNFYGISNSIISILDSISDVAFVVFLFSFNTISKYEGYETQTNNKITNFMITLCIVNLISIGIVIAFYITSKMEFVSQTRLILVCLAFFMLSPVMPAMGWAIEKYKSNGADILLISPWCDGLLLWFEE